MLWTVAPVSAQRNIKKISRQEVQSEQDLPVIYAEPMDNQKYIDWNKVLKSSEDYDIMGDCSYPVTVLTASSTLTPQGKYRYDLCSLSDNDPRTAWVEGVSRVMLSMNGLKSEPPISISFSTAINPLSIFGVKTPE